MLKSDVGEKWLEIDLDGVLVDLDLIVEEKYGKGFNDIHGDEVKILWNEHFEPEWFAEAEPYHDYMELIRYARRNFSKVSILTALPHYRKDLAAECMLTKLAWVHKYVGKDIPVKFGPYAIDKQKHCDGPHHYLVDDNAQNIRQWGLKGGVAIHHTSVPESIEQLEKFLGKKR